MRPLPWFSNFSQVLSMFDDELLEELLTRVRVELTRRGKFDAGNYVERARRCVLLDAQVSDPAIGR